MGGNCSKKRGSPEFALVSSRAKGSPQPLTTSDLSAESDTCYREPGYCCYEMDPLSITAGVAGILTLAVSISHGGHDVFHSLKDFRKELTSFTDEIEFISRWLDTLPTGSQSSIVSEPGDLQPSKAFSLLDIEVQNCRATLIQLQTLLLRSKPRDGKAVSNLLRQTSWHMRKLFVRRLLTKLERHKSTLNSITLTLQRELFEQQAKISNSEQSFVRKSIEGQKFQQILTWISPDNYCKRHFDLRRARVNDSGEWLFEDMKFQSWKDSNGSNTSPVLFCPGGVGCGKTILMLLLQSDVADIRSIVVDRLERLYGEKSAVLFVYIEYKDPATQSVSAILANLLKQLLQRLEQSGLPSDINQSLDKFQSSIRAHHMDVTDYVQLILRASKYFVSVYLVIDALDECHSGGFRRNLLTTVNQIRDGANNLKVLISSRPHISLENSFPSTENLEIRASASDLAKYSRAKLETYSHIPETLKTKILTDLLSKTDGTFLLLRFQLNYVCQWLFPSRIRKALQYLPAALNSAYDEVFFCIQLKGLETERLAFKALGWLFHAVRPLTVDELLQALVLEDMPHYTDEDDHLAIELVLECCMGLIVLQTSDFTVRFSHYSIVEYLRERGDLISTSLDIGQSCVKYLLHAKNRAHPFYSYAARNWTSHVKDHDSDPALSTQIMELLTSEMKFKSMLTCFSDEFDRVTPVHVVALAGLLNTLELLLKDTRCINTISERDIKGRTPLHNASRLGHGKIVLRLLHEAGIEIDAKDNESMTPLQQAAEAGHSDVVSTLVNAGASVDGKDIHGRTTLIMALSGRDDISARAIFYRVLVSNNFDISIRYAPLNQTLLHQMANLGYDEGVSILLSLGADLHAEDTCGYTPVHLAARKGHTQIVRRLIEATGNGVAPSYRHHTPLHLAAKHGWKATVELLLSRNPTDVNVRDSLGFTPLHSAAAAGHIEVVKTLLPKTEEAVAPEGLVPSPLQLAIWGGHCEVKGFLEEYCTIPGNICSSSSFDLQLLLAIEQVTKEFRPRSPLPFEIHGLSSLAEHYGLTHLKAGRLQLASAWYDIALMAFSPNSGILDPAMVTNPIKCCDHCHADPIIGPCYTCTSCVGPCYDLCEECYQKRSEMHRHSEYFMVPSAGYPLPSLEGLLPRLENIMSKGDSE